MTTSSNSKPEPVVTRQQSWYVLCFKAISHPTAAGFSRLLDETNVSVLRSLGWVFSASIAGGLISWGISPGFLAFNAQTGDIALSLGLDTTVAGCILVFVVELFILHIVSRALGGSGDLRRMALLLACYSVPLILLAALISGVESLIVHGSLPLGKLPYGTTNLSQLTPATPAGDAIRWLLILVRLTVDVSAVRAAYRLELPKAIVPSLVFGVTFCGVSLCVGMIFG